MTRQSLQARLILASVLWTTGLLMLMHMASLLLIHVFPSVLRIHSPIVIMAALAVMAAGLWVARSGLAPFRPLRDHLAAIRKGESTQVAGVYPAEVQPLIDDLNALLLARQKAVTKAQATAADLAHGLKTPLALLSAEAERAAAAGHSALADSLRQQVDRMARQIDYHLARARATASGSAGAALCPVAPCVDALLRTLAKLHAPRSLHLSASVPPEIQVQVQREDLEEMLGNLLDNACKWAKTEVRISAVRSGPGITINVDDDGPGLDPTKRGVVLERGVRLDQAAPGSGLGLAIVRDLVELYGGSISLDTAPLGGLRVRIALPVTLSV